MASKLFLAVVLVFNLMAFAPAVSAGRRTKPICHDDESLALLQFKKSLINNCGEFDLSSNHSKVSFWVSESSNCCEWSGIKCDQNTGHVVSLDLSNSCLLGPIKSNNSLFQLVHLQKLNLAYNYFNNSQIPTSFRHLSRLTSLNLSFAGFFGQFPSEILELSKLVSLDISGYRLGLSEPILMSMTQNLTNLKELHLSEVNMSSIVPKTVANLSSLTSLFLDGCDLHGKFPTEIFHLPNLQFIDVSYNWYLKGSMPKFNQSSHLESLELAYMNFSSKLPNSVSNLKSLQHFGVHECNFYGPIPSSFGNLTQLVWLQVSENRFQGEFPIDIFHLHNLQNLDVIGNINLSGCIPKFNQSSSLQSLKLSYTSFFGKLPNSMSNLTFLQHVAIFGCNFLGSIPSSFGDLAQLVSLYVSENRFHGEFPNGIFQLPNLKDLLVSFNENLTLGLPEFNRSSSLEDLEIYGTSFSSKLQNSIGNLKSLYDFYTTRCNFFGPIPPSIGNLTQLRILELEGNNLHGSIPKSISKLVNLEVLDLGSNYLSGIMEFDLFLKHKKLNLIYLSHNNISLLTKPNTNATFPKFQTLGLSYCHLSEFPSFLRNQDQLNELDLSWNEIHGHVPKWMWDATKDTLQILDLSFNFLTCFDEFPVFSTSSKLEILRLDSNELQGSLPIPPPSITWYSIAKNKLIGDIQHWNCNLSSIIILDLSSNDLSGSLPQCFGNLSKTLFVLNLHQNNFHGSIPSFWKCTNLEMIDLSQNLFHGPLPRSLASCTLLEVLNLGDNQINDSFPFWLGTLPKLKVLILRSNRFFGTIENPITSFDFSHLHVMDLSNNDITGMLASQFFQTLKAMQTIKEKSLKYISNTYYNFSMTFINKGNVMVYEKILDFFIAIDLSNNKFEREIPEIIGHLKGLILLNLSNNFLTGHIPSSLGNLTELESLDLSQNKLFGAIPLQLVQLNFLAIFNVSHNHLIGPIPFGEQFNTFDNTSFSDNLGLCGNPLSKKCKNFKHSNSPTSTFKDNQTWRSLFEFNWKVVVMGYGCGFVVGLVMGITKKHDWFTKTFAIGQPTQKSLNWRQHRS